MFRNKKGQIAQTITWVVATIIIVVIMTISFFVANSKILNDSKLDFIDKQKDFVATKSVTSFVEENFDLIESSVKDDNFDLLNDLLKTGVDPFLEILPIIDNSPLALGWSFVLKNSENNNLFRTGQTWKYYRDIELVFDQPNNFKIIAGEQCKECSPKIYSVIR